ncbi:MAG: hypothetical protein WCO55_05610 [Candidatus Falkowbacteria bacterium]
MQVVNQLESLKAYLDNHLPGSHVVLCEIKDDGWASWCPHPDGIVVGIDGKLYLNGVDVIHADRCDDWRLDEQGRLITRVRDELWSIGVNGNELLFKGSADSWMPYGGNLIVEIGDDLIMNSTELLYHGDFDDWCMSYEGIVIQIADQILLKGTEVLYDGDFDAWDMCPKGLVIETNGGLWLDGEQLLYDGAFDNWACTEHGFIIEVHNQFHFYLYPENAINS